MMMIMLMMLLFLYCKLAYEYDQMQDILYKIILGHVLAGYYPTQYYKMVPSPNCGGNPVHIRVLVSASTQGLNINISMW